MSETENELLFSTLKDIGEGVVVLRRDPVDIFSLDFESASGRNKARPSSEPPGEASASDLEAVKTWLERDGGRYRGKWVALSDSELVEADDDLSLLSSRLRSSGRLTDVLILRIPE